MKLTLIKPNIGRLGHSLYVDEGRMEPLQLGVLAALTPAEVEVNLFDDRMEQIRYDDPTDLVAITVETFTARRAYEISAQYRKRGVPVVMGGMHPTLLPDEVKEHADAVVIADAEPVWAQVIADARNTSLQPFYHSEPGRPQTGFKTRRDIFKGKGYLPVSLVQFSRGCRFSCDYCAISAYFAKQHFLRNVREVVAEIESQERRLIFFVDDNFLFNREAAKMLCRELVPLKIRWFSQGSIDMTTDRELMELMVKSGCLGHVVGFESLNPENLGRMNKSPNLSVALDRYREPIRIMKEHGLQTWAAFVFGYDQETERSIEETCQFAIENKFCFAAFNVLMPYPRTPLYARLQQEGRLLYDGKWWLNPQYRFNHAAFIPQNMSPDQLTEACFRARKRFNSFSSILYRLCDPQTNLRSLFRAFFHMRYNPLYRKETLKKHGMYLGAGRV